MKQLLIQVDDELARRLDLLAPGKSRQRSEFVRAAIRKAVWDAEEEATARAYALKPDGTNDAYVDPKAWEAPKVPRSRRKK